MSFSQYEDFVSSLVYKSNNGGESNHRQRTAILKAIEEIIKEKLTDRQRQMMLMYFFENKKMPEIAEELCVNKSTVCRTIARAVKKIKDYTKYYLLR